MCGIVGVGTVQGAPGASMPSPAILAATVAPVTTAMMEEDLSEPGSWSLNPSAVRRKAVEALWSAGIGGEPIDDAVLTMRDEPGVGVVIEPLLLDPDVDQGLASWQIEVLGGRNELVNQLHHAEPYVDPESGDSGVLVSSVELWVSHLEIDLFRQTHSMLADVLTVNVSKESSTGDRTEYSHTFVNPVEINWDPALAFHVDARVALLTGTTFNEDEGRYEGPMGPRPHGLMALDCNRVKPSDSDVMNQYCDCWNRWNFDRQSADQTLQLCKDRALRDYLIAMAVCAAALALPAGGAPAYVLCVGAAFAVFAVNLSDCEQDWAREQPRLDFDLAHCFRDLQRAHYTPDWIRQWLEDEENRRNPPAGLELPQPQIH